MEESYLPNKSLGKTEETYWEVKMKIYELVIEMKLLERRLTLYEEKYGVLSENFMLLLCQVS